MIMTVISASRIGTLLLRLSELLKYPEEGMSELFEGCRPLIVSDFNQFYDTFDEAQRYFLGMDIWEWEEYYTATFDLQPQAFPYAAHHLFGEDYKRGLMMAGLKRGFEECGIDLGSELPDYVPLLLCLYVRLNDREKAASLRDELLLPSLKRMEAKLAAGHNVYANLIGVVMGLLRIDAEDGHSKIEE